MKRKPHFRYYWEDYNQNVIVANVRNDIATRVNRDNKTENTGYTSTDWQRMDGSNASLFRITRAKARRWFKANKVPVSA